METVESKLAAIWVKTRPLMLERVALLETLTAAAMTAEMRVEAIGVAHKLAGSLGMFGFHEGTRIAREVEVLLEGDGVVDRPRVSELVRELRGTVFA